MQSGRYEEALGYFDKALALDPNHDYALSSKGEALDRLGRHKEAVEYYERVLASNITDFYGSNMNKGISLLGLSRYPEAVEHFDELLAVNPNDIDALLNKGVALYKIGKYEESVTYFDKVLALDPNNFHSLLNKGAALTDLGKYQEAITYYDRLIAEYPNYHEAFVNKGVALGKLGRYQEAIGYFDKALGENTSASSTLLTNSRQHRLSTNYYLVAEKNAPTISTALLNNLEAAEYLHYATVSKSGKGVDIALVDKGIALFHVRKYSDAMVVFDSILVIDPDYVACVYYKGLLLDQLGKHDEAAQYKDKAKDLNPAYDGDFMSIVVTKAPLSELISGGGSGGGAAASTLGGGAVTGNNIDKR
jgi:tetratricopeptide (TPR) repeat protein